jgi:hypothetical protein
MPSSLARSGFLTPPEIERGQRRLLDKFNLCAWCQLRRTKAAAVQAGCGASVEQMNGRRSISKGSPRGASIASQRSRGTGAIVQLAFGSELEPSSTPPHSKDMHW